MPLRVTDEHRLHDLSLTPGGSDVTAVMSNGKKLIYDKIKHVKGYCNRLILNYKVMEIYVDGELYWKRNQ